MVEQRLFVTTLCTGLQGLPSQHQSSVTTWCSCRGLQNARGLWQAELQLRFVHIFFGAIFLAECGAVPNVGPVLLQYFNNSRVMRDQISQMRSQLEEDEQVKTLMAGLRGYNIDDSDFADDSVVMRLVNVDTDDPDDELPLTYSPELIEDYWGRRPVAVTSRIAQLLGIAPA